MSQSRSQPAWLAKREEARGEAQDYLIQRDNQPDLKFKGWLLAKASTHNPNVVQTDPMRNVIINTGSKRWKEWSVYQTKGGSFVLVKAGCTSVKGELDRYEVEVFDPKKPGLGALFRELRGSVATAVEVPVIEASANDDDRLPRDRNIEDVIKNFFGRHPLAKQLYAQLGMQDTEEID